MIIFTTIGITTKQQYIFLYHPDTVEKTYTSLTIYNVLFYHELTNFYHALSKNNVEKIYGSNSYLIRVVFSIKNIQHTHITLLPSQTWEL
ncbi:hypothetical protein U14_01761 [Candidatus Moduliflexus flocculans]|uniref:Uncharacterized protein n=1 Tax=Candidatus Moduliflexus flocculans TaxID=1499966 RepID=A0A0S6VT05_9BACT|nr:hypothetical protein U14_01761 [Candidatus Moduliflexus flocculans]